MKPTNDPDTPRSCAVLMVLAFVALVFVVCLAVPVVWMIDILLDLVRIAAHGIQD